MSELEKPEVPNETVPVAEPTTPDTKSWLQSSPLVPLRDLTGKTLGDFQVERLLGRGGMGEVYLARQVSLNRPVALKVLRPDLLSQESYLKRFEAEATAVAKLNHPNIVHIYTLGHIQDIRFIAMEFVQGMNLRDYLIKKGALELSLALSIMRQAGVAVSVAGEHGLVHRDIKPENLLLTRKGQVKVADFGLCRDQDSDMHHTLPGVTMGTPAYMSPEQAQGHPTDHRSDLYSLGVTFYHMLAGVAPFKADTPLALALKHVKDIPKSIAVHRPDIAPELDRLVLKLMAKEPADRYQSAAEMLKDLSRIRESVHAPTAAVPMADVSLATMAAAPTMRLSGSNGSTPALAETVASPAVPARGPLALVSGGPAGRHARIGLMATCLIAGLVVGWLARPADLLAEGAPGPDDELPALWMAPAWRDVPRRNNAEEQYHAAQLGVANVEAEAAWLAVPGHYPNSRDWASRAYVQLARSLLRRRDIDRLRVLAAEVARWNPERMHEKELAIISEAAVKALDGSVEDVIERLGPQNLSLDTVTDSALLELALEVTVQAKRAAARSDPAAATPSGLQKIQEQLLRKLYFEESRVPIGRRPG